MSGSRKFHDVLMGYGENSASRDRYMTTYAGRCVSCGTRTYVVPSAWNRLRDSDSDPVMVCDYCWPRVSDDLERAMADG